MHFCKFVSIVVCFLSAIKWVENQQQRVNFKRVVSDGQGKYTIEQVDEVKRDDLKILIAITVKDNQYSLPTFLATLETLECPNKDKKCDLWLIFDECTDKSFDIFANWLSSKRPIFDTILMIDTKNDAKTRESHPELNEAYFSKNLKKRALAYAIDKKFDYILFLKADAILTNPKTIDILISKKKSIVAPLLTSSESKHSTFWHEGEDEMVNDFYLPIYNRVELGCFKVLGVQDCFLVDLNDKRMSVLIEGQSNNADADYEFSVRARAQNIIMHVCNREVFGYVPDSIPNREASFTHLRIEHLLKGAEKTYNQPLPVSEHIDYTSLVPKAPKSKLGFDEIYVINLERRDDRRQRIESTFDDLRVDYKLFKAVDGSKIDEEYIKSLGIKTVPKYVDPYTGRGMNYGEIGCFLSHYFIWKEVVEKKYKKVIIFEDDVRFVLNFNATLEYLLGTMNENSVKWDLLFLGRKAMKAEKEFWEKNVQTINGYGIVHPAYSHWTLAYALTYEGANKLLKPEPLGKLLPVDEYLPLMMDQQPSVYWTSFFPVRDVKALAIYPAVVNPTHYLGEPSYISDTEFTPVLKEEDADGAKEPIEASINDDSSITIKSRIEL